MGSEKEEKNSKKKKKRKYSTSFFTLSGKEGLTNLQK